MNLSDKFRMAGAVLVISLGPAAFADQLTPKLASVGPPSLVKWAAVTPPSYTISVEKNRAVVLEILGDFWTNSKISSTWKATGPSAFQLAQVKVGINKLLQPLKLGGLSPLLQRPLISVALSLGGWKVHKNVPIVKVPEAPVFALLGLNMAALLGFAFVFRRRIIRLS